jgi:hypothetical protein
VDAEMNEYCKRCGQQLIDPESSLFMANYLENLNRTINSQQKIMTKLEEEKHNLIVMLEEAKNDQNNHRA